MQKAKGNHCNNDPSGFPRRLRTVLRYYAMEVGLNVKLSKVIPPQSDFWDGKVKAGKLENVKREMEKHKLDVKS